MKLVELKELLEATGMPVAYSHFEETDNTPLPEPPFICYITPYSSNFAADNHIFQSIDNVQIELYTDKKDLIAENNLETILNANELPFSTTEIFIDSEHLHQKIYETRLI